MSGSEGLSRRAFLTTAASSLAAMTHAAGAPAAAGTRRYREDRRLDFVQPWVIRDLAPGRSGHNFTQAGITETLVEARPDGRLVPGLARAWRASADLRSWTFTLRPGVVFHDGTPATAEAVAASLDALLPASTAFADVAVRTVAPVEGAVAIRLEAPFAHLPALLADPSVAVLARSSFGASGQVVDVVGTGPFRLAAVDPPFRLASRGFPRHRAGAPRYAALGFRALIDPAERAERAIAGACDVAIDLPREALPALAENPDMAVERAVTPRVHLLQVNAALPQFADPRVRRALHMAIDRRTLAAVAVGDPALAAPQYFSPAVPLWHDPDLETDPCDPAAANGLLDALGWRRGADGVRCREGVRLEATIHAFRRRPELSAMATRIARQLGEIGLAAEVRIADWPEIEALRMAGGLSMALTSANPGVLADPALGLVRDFSRPDGSAAGAVGWWSARMTALLDAYSGAADAAAATRARRAIAHLLDRELPVLPLVRCERINAVREGVVGYRTDPLERRYLF